MHLKDGKSSPLDVSMLRDLDPVPPSIRFISWGCRSGKTAFRVVHDEETKTAYGVPFPFHNFEVERQSEDVVFDWTGENTFRDYLDL